MPFIVSTLPGSDLEEVSLNGLALNDSVFGLMELQCPPPKQRQEWIGAADSEHQTLVRDPLYENREIIARIAVAPSADMDGAINRIGQVRDALASASKSEDGVALEWNPAGSTFVGTFDVLAGEVTDLPINWENGWLAKSPEFTIRMDCKPYWRGVETLTSTASASAPFVTMEVTNAIGDVPAIGRLIVTDTASQSRRHVEWGLEGPNTYDAATSLLLDSDSLVTSGFAGVQWAAVDAYDPNASGNTAVRADLYSSPVAVCGTGNQSHVGVYRVKARINASSPAVHRFTWQVGDGPVTSNSWVANTGSGTWVEQDLGTITIAPVTSGTQRWKGTVEAYISSPGAFSTFVDYLILVPVLDGYGKARATYTYRPGVIVGSDLFTGTTAGNALNARVAPAGGTWATSGSATDFLFADDLSGEQVKRTTTADASARFAILGATNYTDVEVQCSIDLVASAATSSRLGVIARWTDSSNYVYGSYANTPSFSIRQVVAGVETTIVSLPTSSIPVSRGTWYKLRLLVFASGRAILQLLDAAGNQLAQADGSSTTLATGGTLATGKVGILDTNPSVGAATRYYDDFTVATPSVEPIVMYSGRTIEFRSDTTIRQDSTGTYTGPPSSYFPAGRFRLPVGTSRVLVKARRNDIDTAADDQVTDATQIQVAVTPRGLVVPRA